MEWAVKRENKDELVNRTKFFSVLFLILILIL